MQTHPINLELINKSRKRLKPGDIFALKPIGHDYYFGRVVSTTAHCGFGPPKAILIYIYNAHSKEKDKIPKLDKNNLLIPPCMINRLGWSRGYFENVEFKEFDPREILELHCFWDPIKKIYVNEKEEQINKAYESVGLFALGNYRTVDRRVSKALGIPLPPME